MEKFQAEPEGVLALLVFPAPWRHRRRTTNLGEGWFKHLRRYLSRFPGLHNAEHPTTHFQQNAGQWPYKPFVDVSWGLVLTFEQFSAFERQPRPPP